MKWRYSRRTMMVRCILVDTTVPVRIRPRMETRPVKGHFLSAKRSRGQQSFPPWRSLPLSSAMAQPSRRRGLLSMRPNRGAVRRGNRRRQAGCGCLLHVPMYWPSMAVLGVRKPRPTSLYHRRCRIWSAFGVLPHCHVQHGMFSGHSHHPCRDAWSCSW